MNSTSGLKPRVLVQADAGQARWRFGAAAHNASRDLFRVAYAGVIHSAGTAAVILETNSSYGLSKLRAAFRRHSMPCDQTRRP